ncbi:hypothetical protein [Streptomyces sp. NPDC058155]|uniref:hypothetical protein n=1 Tax=Streptomyces sp. NPDC058155 TaxID=3346359 RepID=UPI0036EA469A
MRSLANRKRKLLTSLLAAPAALGLVLTTATSASAHYVYYAEIVWANADSSLCLMNYSETSHGSTGGGYFKGQARSQADIDLNPLDCILPWERNTGQLGEGMIMYKWYEEGETWLVCERTDRLYYNSSPASTFELAATAPVGALCGEGYYGLHNYALMQDSGEWYGADVSTWSGSHWLPDTSSRSATEAPPQPEWLKSGSQSKAPEAIPVADKSGKPVMRKDGSPLMVAPTFPEPTEENGTLTGGKRTFTTDEDGNITERVTVELVRPTR